MNANAALWATLIDQHSVQAVIRALRSDGNDSTAKLQLQWITLSACRPCEAQLIKHGEIDLVRKVWTIPAERTKANREHVVPITNAMVELFFAAANQHPTSEDYVFANQCSALLGVRSAFAEWAKSDGRFSFELILEQLGHRPNAVDAAHSRQSMMEAWATYVMGGANA